MQLQTHRTQFGSRITGDVKYLKISQAMKTILKEEGIKVNKDIEIRGVEKTKESFKGLYKGNLPAEYLYLTYNAVEFWTYKELESFLESIVSVQVVSFYTVLLIQDRIKRNDYHTLSRHLDVVW
jgi:solute carrier family 25 thiamine pyrophosphate transporter 19